MAERVGFEPTVPVKVQQFSRLPDSTTLAPLRKNLILMVCMRLFKREVPMYKKRGGRGGSSTPNRAQLTVGAPQYLYAVIVGLSPFMPN